MKEYNKIYESRVNGKRVDLRELNIDDTKGMSSWKIWWLPGGERLKFNVASYSIQYYRLYFNLLIRVGEKCNKNMSS